MNTILRMNLVMMKDKLKSMNNQGFNYKDRKMSKAGKIWVKEDRSKLLDLEHEEKKLRLISQIRNGILQKDIDLLTRAVTEAKSLPSIMKDIGLDVTHAELVIHKAKSRMEEMQRMKELYGTTRHIFIPQE